MPPSYIRVRAIVWAYGRGQTDTQTRVTTIHFASSTTHAKCNYDSTWRQYINWFFRRTADSWRDVGHHDSVVYGKMKPSSTSFVRSRHWLDVLSAIVISKVYYYRSWESLISQLHSTKIRNKIHRNSYPHPVLSTWNDLSPNETDFSSQTRFKLSLTPRQLLRHCKVYLDRHIDFGC